MMRLIDALAFLLCVLVVALCLAFQLIIGSEVLTVVNNELVFAVLMVFLVLCVLYFAPNNPPEHSKGDYSGKGPPPTADKSQN